jgi:hypothetical protein
MASKKKIQLYRGGFKVDFWMEGKGREAEVHCAVYSGQRGSDGKMHYLEPPILEWAFPKIPGNNIIGNAAIYLDQAIMYAKDPPK